MKTFAIILASGAGERVGYHIPKQFIKIAGKTVLEHTLDVFERSPSIDEIFVITHPAHRILAEEILLRSRYRKVSRLLNGGATRRESAWNGISAIDVEREPDARVLLHDAVRPFVTERIIRDCLLALETHGAVDVAIPAADTIIQVDEARFIRDIPPRKTLMRGQTPQAFRLGTIREAHRLAAESPDLSFTDDCGIVLHFGLSPVFVVQGDESNIKITYPEDIFLADKLFQLRAIEHVDPSPDQLVHQTAELAGKVVVVFGATKGIGAAIAEKAAAGGARVLGYARANGVDVADHAAVSRALAEAAAAAGRIDYVVNTAGVLRMGKLETRAPEAVDEEVAINYTGAVNVVRAAVPYLRDSRGGLLLFTSSSYTRGRALYSIYSSTKAAIVNLVQACSEELFDDGVRINCINPERTATPMRLENFGPEPEGSLLSAQRVAEVSLLTLASDLTGQVIYVTRRA